MPDIARVLKEEITRLARKEARTSVLPLTVKIRNLRKTLGDQKQQLAELKRELSRKADKELQVRIDPKTAEPGASRISPGSIRKHRERLKLSQQQLGTLLHVSSLTVSSWENGHSTPREQKRLAIAELRKMGVRDVRERLENLTQ